MALVARHFDVSLAALNRPAPSVSSVRARQVRCTDPQRRLAPAVHRQAFGGKDHSTVLHAIRRSPNWFSGASIADELERAMKEFYAASALKAVSAKVALVASRGFAGRLLLCARWALAAALRGGNAGGCHVRKQHGYVVEAETKPVQPDVRTMANSAFSS